MSLSSISWPIGRLVGSSSPALPITPSLKDGLPWSPGRWACIAGLNLSRNACRPAPHLVDHLPRRHQRLVQNSSSRSRSSGVNSTRPRLSATDYAPRAGRAMGWVVLMVVSSWSSRSADVTTIRCPRPGVAQGGLGLDRVCLVTETSPDDLGVSGSMGRCPPDYDPAAGAGHHPTRMISRRPRPGRISPPKAVVSLTQDDGRVAPGWTAWVGQQARQELDGH
jgi:hypothetical protein